MVYRVPVAAVTNGRKRKQRDVTRVYYLSSGSQRVRQVLWVSLLQVPRARTKVLVDLGWSLEVLGEHPLPSALGWLEEVRSNGWTELPAPAGCWLGHCLFEATWALPSSKPPDTLTTL